MSGKKLLLLALAALALLLGGAFLLWNEGTKADLEAARQRLRDAHLPMTVDDIRPPPVPDADNAALVLEKIAPLLRALPQVDGKDFLMWFGDFQSKHKELHLDATATKELGDQLDSPPVQAVLALIREAAGKKEFNSNTDYSRGPQLFRYISPLQQSAKLLGGHARLAASRGQSGEAAADVWAMTSLAEFPAKEPPALITLLTRVAIWGITTAEMERLAVTGDLAPEWNQKFSARLAGINLSADLVRAFDVERIVFGQQTFDQLLAGTYDLANDVGKPDGWRDWKKWVRLQAYRLPGVIRSENADYLDYMRVFRAAVAAGAQNREALERRLGNVASYSPGGLILEVLVPTLEALSKNVLLRSHERLTVVQVGLAMERYRAAKGGYPAALSDLVPDFIKEVPPDVFTGKPLLYRTEPGGAVIYSVGKNLKDDGGIDDMDADKDDINWASGADDEP